MIEAKLSNNVVSKYDRIRGGLEGVAQFAKPTTIKHVWPVSGYSTTLIVEVCKHEVCKERKDKHGEIETWSEVETICFIENLDGGTVTKIVLPQKALQAIVRQQETLTKRARRAAGKARAQADKAAGVVPGFMRKERKHARSGSGNNVQAA